MAFDGPIKLKKTFKDNTDRPASSKPETLSHYRKCSGLNLLMLV